MTNAVAPGLYFEVQPRPAEVSPLRTDIAGFAARTRRGPVGQTVRVEGWRDYLRVFGGLIEFTDGPYALSGYFENGGEVAHIVRLAGPDSRPATGTWRVGSVNAAGVWDAASPAAAGFTAAAYRVVASSPGSWANGTRVEIRYRLRGVTNGPELDISVQVPQEPIELITGLSPASVEGQVAERSALIRIEALWPPKPVAYMDGHPTGPTVEDWVVTLSGGTEVAPSYPEYTEAIQRLGDEREVALTALPDLYRDRLTKDERLSLIRLLAQQADAAKDRQVLLDLQPDISSAAEATRWVRQFHAWDAALVRTLVTYFPRLRVRDPLAGINQPLRTISPSGHVAGVISRLDRIRGAHYTPANALLFEAVDVEPRFLPTEQGVLTVGGVNLVRCISGRGLQVWGGRTFADPDVDRKGLFLAHRRLIHRLVRAIRRVAEPLVFDPNGQELWLTLVRAITTVLLEAFRAGALKGVRPEQAFRVKCDEENNPPEERELGRVLCEIDVAPAVPMEFITLRIALSGEGRLEVFEQ